MIVARWRLLGKLIKENQISILRASKKLKEAIASCSLPQRESGKGKESKAKGKEEEGVKEEGGEGWKDRGRNRVGEGAPLTRAGRAAERPRPRDFRIGTSFNTSPGRRGVAWRGSQGVGNWPCYYIRLRRQPSLLCLLLRYQNVPLLHILQTLPDSLLCRPAAL